MLGNGHGSASFGRTVGRYSGEPPNPQAADQHGSYPGKGYPPQSPELSPKGKGGSKGYGGHKGWGEGGKSKGFEGKGWGKGKREVASDGQRIEYRGVAIGIRRDLWGTVITLRR